MGQRLVALATCVAVMTTIPAWAADRRADPPPSRAVIDDLKAHTDQTIDAFLAGLRPMPLDAAARSQVIATLPEKGNLRPSRAEGDRIAAAERVLDYSARRGIITVRVIELDYAFVGLYFRTVVLVSRQALAVVTPDEFAALVAHEVGHDYDWDAYWTAMQQHDHARMRQLELRADAIAVLTLQRNGVAPDRLISAVQKVTRYNERLGATANAEDYVSLAERVPFIREVAGLAWPKEQTDTLAVAGGPPPR